MSIHQVRKNKTKTPNKKTPLAFFEENRHQVSQKKTLSPK